MRVKFMSNEKLDVLESLVNRHLVGLGQAGYKVAGPVDLKVTPFNGKFMFTAVITEECLRDRQEREDYGDVPSYLR